MVSVTQEHAKYGRQSLRWDWQPGAELVFHHPIDFRPLSPDAGSNALSTFVVWIYSPARHASGSLRFEFGRAGVRDCWFEFGLDFTGWRTCWVAFERDMQGRPRPDMDTLRVVAPAGSSGGTVCLDSLVLSQPIDARHHTRDKQVPFVNTCLPTDANDHWLGLYRFDREAVPDLPLPAGAIAATDTIAARYEQLFARDARSSPEALAGLRRRFAAWEIHRTSGGITGRAVAYPHEAVAYPAGSSEQKEAGVGGLQGCTKLLFDLAQAFRGAADPARRDEMRSMFFDLSDHLLDQGWAAGSGMGTLHHLGYSCRFYYPAMFLMREQLRASGRLPEVRQAMAWFSGAGKAYVPLGGVDGISIDTLNTTLIGQIAAQLLIEDGTERARALLATARWLGRSLEPCTGLAGGIKADGSLLHHGNHYPAYAEGGITGAAQALWLLSGTPLRVPEAGHASLRRAALTLRFQSNVLQWPLSLSGRHPNASFSLSPEPYLFLARSGTPDGSAPVDLEVAGAWRRLADAAEKSPVPARSRKSSGAAESLPVAAPSAIAVAAEAAPTGHISLSYGTSALHRRAHWLATARGFSRYLWGAEIYPGANMFGRYLAYGHVEILAGGDPVTLAGSGFSEEGWDWNCWPGTTAIHLPLDLLRERVNNVDAYSGFEEMLLSDEAFAGASSLGGRDGVFAMKLHEHGKYDGSHRARKSVFFFDDHLVLLGSGITNNDRGHATRTTLFQQRLRDRAAPVQIDERPALEAFPSDLSRSAAGGASLRDTVGNSYYLLSAGELHVTKSTQSSRSQNDRSDTRGDFVLAWLDHGPAPRDAGYAYAILIQPDGDRRQSFAAALGRAADAPFAILRRDHVAHIVSDRSTGILAAACFEPVSATGLAVAAVDAPALVMLRQTAGGATLSVCDPDLHLYSGSEADQLLPDGRQREVSVYSRPWFRSASAPSRVRVTLDGTFTLARPEPRVRVVASAAGTTILEFTCRDGLPVEVELARRSATAATTNLP